MKTHFIITQHAVARGIERDALLASLTTEAEVREFILDEITEAVDLGRCARTPRTWFRGPGSAVRLPRDGSRYAWSDDEERVYPLRRDVVTRHIRGERTLVLTTVLTRTFVTSQREVA